MAQRLLRPVHGDRPRPARPAPRRSLPGSGLTRYYIRRSLIDEPGSIQSLCTRRRPARPACRAVRRHRAGCAAGPNIELRVLPFSAGAHASPTGAFRIFTMEKPFPEVGYVETPKGAIYVESPDTQRKAGGATRGLVVSDEGVGDPKPRPGAK
ncbi:Scr1 family TA system antitoxin-like transcriptional regulator [Streptosporangium canum]|uniref:Scr1 family TA system antitoxin-like transcriptional regulator n=1 Tax=Streptosporangium canum TaxID=324952 RepID=UPI003413D417